MMRLLITGSRTWTNPLPIWDTLNTFHATAQSADQVLVVVHGACRRGVDHFTAVWCHRHRGDPSVVQEPHPANWLAYGRRAGPIRNHAMVTAGAVACIAFVRDSSRGTVQCANAATAAGIPVIWHHWPAEDAHPSTVGADIEEDQ